MHSGVKSVIVDRLVSVETAVELIDTDFQRSPSFKDKVTYVEELMHWL